MRIGWRIPLPGPFSVSGTVWRSKPRRRSKPGHPAQQRQRGYNGTLQGWTCPHNHSRPDLAVACAQRYAHSPEYQAQQAVSRRPVAEREAARQECAAVKARARIARCVATAAAEVMAAIPAHGGTLPAGNGPAALEDAIREIIQDRTVTGYLRESALAKARRIPAPAKMAGIALALGLTFATHGLILIPVIIAGSVLAIRRGKIGKLPGLATAAVLIALAATMSALTGNSGSSSAQVASQAPDTSASAPATHAPATPAAASHAPPTHATTTHAPPTHAAASHAPATHAQAPALVTHAPATHTPAPAPVTHAPATVTHAPVTQAPAPVTQAPARTYRAGEYCSAHGRTAVDAHGAPLTCAFKNGWRWEH